MDWDFSMWFPRSATLMWSRFGFGILLSQNISIWFCFKARELNCKSVGLFCGFCGWLLMVYRILAYIMVVFGSCAYFAWFKHLEFTHRLTGMWFPLYLRGTISFRMFLRHVVLFMWANIPIRGFVLWCCAPQICSMWFCFIIMKWTKSLRMWSPYQLNLPMWFCLGCCLWQVFQVWVLFRIVYFWVPLNMICGLPQVSCTWFFFSGCLFSV
jgi:hypothetical protein